MKPPISILLCGVGGFGEWYIPPLLNQADSLNIRFIGAVDAYLERCRALPELQARGIPLFHSLEEFYANHRCDLVVVASPIHVHCQHVCVALFHGSHVLCEKPLCASVPQAELMAEAEKSSGKTVTIGYQWSFSPAIQKLKGDFLAGKLGQPRRFRTIVCWPRGDDYYTRNQWAGRQKTANGEEIFDSPVNNAASHFLHNMFYILGPSVSESIFPVRVEADLWRAYPVENYDTAALRIEMQNGAEGFFYTSHATSAQQGPSFIYEFEKGTVTYDYQSARIQARMSDGEVMHYGCPDDLPYQKLWSAIESARTGARPVCGIAAARAHTLCVALAQKSPESIRNFHSQNIRTHLRLDLPHRYVEGLLELMSRCYQESDLAWEGSFQTLMQAFAEPAHLQPEKIASS